MKLKRTHAEAVRLHADRDGVLVVEVDGETVYFETPISLSDVLAAATGTKVR